MPENDPGWTIQVDDYDPVPLRVPLKAVDPNSTYARSEVARRASTALRGTPVASESLWYDAALSNGTVTNANTRKRHYVYQDASSVRFMYANILGRETLPPNSITVRAGLELPDGTMIPVYFAGKRDVVIDPGGIVASDPVAGDLRGGTYVYSRTLVTVTSGGKWPMQGSPNGLTVPAWGEECDATNGVTQTDKTTSGTIAHLTYGVSQYAPFCLVGIPADSSTPVVGLIGDSIVSGIGDTANPVEGRGFARRVLANQVAYVSIAASGENLVEPRVLREALTYGATHALCNLGVNDIKNAKTATEIRNNLVGVWTRLARRGLKVYQTTLVPYTTSTDTWATVANQTPVDATAEAARVTVNDWIRGGAPMKNGAFVEVGTAGAVTAGQAGHPLTATFDVADTVESARNSGRWKVGMVYTTDNLGIHPSSAGHAAMAAAIPLSTFTS